MDPGLMPAPDCRYRLLPGLVAVRRDDAHLQLGIDPPARAIVPDTADVRRLLTELAEGCGPPDTLPSSLPVRRAFQELLRAGLVREGPGQPSAGVRVDAPPGLAATTRSLLDEALPVAGPAGPDPAEPAQPDAVLVLEPGPLPRERLDPLMRAGTPHLVVQGGPGTPETWTVGPFVVPGATACQRCVDAALAEDDPRRGIVLEQLTRRRHRTPTDPLLQALAVSWAVRDVLTFLRGQQPPTWSTTVVFRRTGPPEEIRWRRHPHCGCAWDEIGHDSREP